MLEKSTCLDNMRNNRKYVISMLFLSDSLLQEIIDYKSEIHPMRHDLFR